VKRCISASISRRIRSGVPSPGARWYLPWRYGRWRGTNATASPDI